MWICMELEFEEVTRIQYHPQWEVSTPNCPKLSSSIICQIYDDAILCEAQFEIRPSDILYK